MAAGCLRVKLVVESVMQQKPPYECCRSLRAVVKVEKGGHSSSKEMSHLSVAWQVFEDKLTSSMQTTVLVTNNQNNCKKQHHKLLVLQDDYQQPPATIPQLMVTRKSLSGL